jgi:hypothetical protein
MKWPEPAIEADFVIKTVCGLKSARENGFVQQLMPELNEMNETRF